jgi:predicted outer membrane protein
MSAVLRTRIGVVAAGLTCLLLSVAVAQQDQPATQKSPDANRASQTDRASAPQADPANTSATDENYHKSVPGQTDYRTAHAAAGDHNRLVDNFLVSCLLDQNQAEVQLSEIALQKSENPEVKQFAQKMVTDHKKMIEQLQPLAAMHSGANRPASSLLGGTSEAQGRSETTVGRTTDTTALPGSSGAGQTIPPAGATTTSPGTNAAREIAANATANAAMAASGGPVHQLMQIDKQINERCLQMARDELQQKSGAEFDKCYIGNAISAHGQAVAALEVIGKQTQGKLAHVAQQAQPTVQQHLDQAKQLMKQLDSQSSATGTQAQRAANRTE